MSAGEEKWNSVPSATAGKRKAEPSAWNQDPGDNSTNGKDWGRNWSERSIFSGIGKKCKKNFFEVPLKLLIWCIISGEYYRNEKTNS